MTRGRFMIDDPDISLYIVKNLTAMKTKIKSLFEMRYFLKKAGKVPGDLGSEEATFEPSKIEWLQYNRESFHKQMISRDEDIRASNGENQCNWLDVIGLGDIQTIQKVGTTFSIHSLTLEDIINTDHLPKCELSEEHLFFTLKYPIYYEQDDILALKHVSLILSGQHLLTLQEGNEDHLVSIKNRIQNAQGKIRMKNTEYLFYALIDYIVDQYFYIMDMIRDDIEETEDMLIDDPETDHIQKIHLIKKRIVYLRKYITSLNKAVNVLQNKEVKFADKNIKVFLKDVYDHTFHINESLVTSKDLQTTLLEMNMANMSNTMNRVMKTLTIVATIFIPLTFVVGIYGMNFQHMPELQWRYGYPAVLAFMLLIVSGMVVLMKRKKWF